MKRMGEDPDKPLREADAGMEIDESELRTYNDGNPKESFQSDPIFHSLKTSKILINVENK